MLNDEVTQLLKDYRSYEFAVRNCGPSEDYLPIVYNERRRNINQWDKTRYNRIVNMIKGAVNYVLSDDERTVIMRKYMERNTMTLNEIADVLHKDRSTVSRWHSAAIRKIAIALDPINDDVREIHNIDHMFDPNWTYKEAS